MNFGPLILTRSFHTLGTKEVARAFVEAILVYVKNRLLFYSADFWYYRDVSYNNFTWESSSPTECLHGNV